MQKKKILFRSDVNYYKFSSSTFRVLFCTTIFGPATVLQKSVYSVKNSSKITEKIDKNFAI